MTNDERAELDLAARVDGLRRLAGALQAAHTPEFRWVGVALVDWLHFGGSLDQRLGVVPRRGSRATPQRLVAQAGHDRALVDLARAAGSARRAHAIALGLVECPVGLAEVVAALRESGAPVSTAAFTRARQRITRHRR